MIKTIIFDLGGVYFTDGSVEAIEIVSRKYGIEYEKVRQIFKGEIGKNYRTGIITYDEFWDKGKKLWGIEDVPTNELALIWHNGYRPIKGTIEIINQLKSAGYDLIFLSNNVQERVDFLQEKYDFLSKFRDGIFSHIVKVRKPNPMIYKMALELAGIPAKNCVYIDDKAHLIIPAQELGMSGIHFTTSQALKGDLDKIGIIL